MGGYKRVLEGLVRARVLAQEAARLGLAASDAEVPTEFRSIYRASGHFVGIDRYKESTFPLRRGREIEQARRDSILRKK